MIPERRKEMRELILEFIKKYMMEHGYAPSVREIGTAVGLKSTSSVQNHLNMMLAMGVIESDAPKGSPRAIRVPGMKFVEG